MEGEEGGVVGADLGAIDLKGAAGDAGEVEEGEGVGERASAGAGLRAGEADVEGLEVEAVGGGRRAAVGRGQPAAGHCGRWAVVGSGTWTVAEDGWQWEEGGQRRETVAGGRQAAAHDGRRRAAIGGGRLEAGAVVDGWRAVSSGGRWAAAEG